MEEETWQEITILTVVNIIFRQDIQISLHVTKMASQNNSLSEIFRDLFNSDKRRKISEIYYPKATVRSCFQNRVS